MNEERFKQICEEYGFDVKVFDTHMLVYNYLVTKCSLPLPFCYVSRDRLHSLTKEKLESIFTEQASRWMS